MYFPASAGRRLFAAPLLVLSALLALFALVISPATPAHAYNGSTSACSHTGTTNWTDEGQQNNISTDPNRFQVPFDPTGTPTYKTIQVAVLYVDFSDKVGTGTLNDYFNRISPAADYLWTASYNHTWLSMGVPYNNWLRMPGTSTSYGWTGTHTSPSGTDQRRYMADAVAAASAAGVDLTKYDMFYVMPTTNATTIDNSPAFIWDPNNPINQSSWHWNGSAWQWLSTTIHWGSTLGQDVWGSWGYHIPVHETGHTFGLPDLYAFNPDPGLDLHEYVGGWDIMGNIGGPGNQYFGWQSWKLGWTKDTQVSCIASHPANGSTSYRTTLDAVERVSSSAYKIAVVQASNTTAYVVESRRATGNDSGICATGALIYLVDWSTTTGHGPIRVVQNPNVTSINTSCSSYWNDFYTWQPNQSFSTWTDYGHITISVVSNGTNGDTVDTTLSAT